MKYESVIITLSSLIARAIWAKKTKNILKTYTVAITNKDVTEYMAKKLSSSGLTFENLVRFLKF